jgi:hypothetical protein
MGYSFVISNENGVTIQNIIDQIAATGRTARFQDRVILALEPIVKMQNISGWEVAHEILPMFPGVNEIPRFKYSGCCYDIRQNRPKDYTKDDLRDNCVPQHDSEYKWKYID